MDPLAVRTAIVATETAKSVLVGNLSGQLASIVDAVGDTGVVTFILTMDNGNASNVVNFVKLSDLYARVAEIFGSEFTCSSFENLLRFLSKKQIALWVDRLDAFLETVNAALEVSGSALRVPYASVVSVHPPAPPRGPPCAYGGTGPCT